MQPDQTPRQQEARQPDDFPCPPQPHGLGAGECGDAIWEASAQEGGVVDASTPNGRGAARPRGRETGVRGGRLIDLVERPRRRDQADG
jgi:hypothetical protein